MADRIHGTCRRARSPVKAKGRQRAAVARLRPARGSLSGPHFACGAGAPPEVPGGRHHVRISRLGRRLLDGRMDDAVRPVQLLARVLAWSRVERRRWSWLGLPGAWANTEPATMVPGDQQAKS